MPNFEMDNKIILGILTVVVNAYSMYLFNIYKNDNKNMWNSPLAIIIWVLITISIIFTGMESYY